MTLTIKANDETGCWEIHDERGFLCKLENESTAKELVRAIDVLPYMTKALRMWIENHQCGSDMTAIYVEWTKRVLAISEARMAKEPKRIEDDPPFLP